tara:strand:- start:1229 stop:2128 length:900 start_codon:yes stop_codon:yes gene_type:complete
MAQLIISYDCEGVWGTLDHLEDLDTTVFNRQSLFSIYSDLLRLHEKYEFNATFAFVGAFIMPKEDFVAHLAEYPNAEKVSKWLLPMNSKSNKFRDQDFFIPELVNLVRDSDLKHEIATHGFSHVIMTDSIDESSLDFEVEGILKTAARHDIDVETIIFPRNIINHEFLNKADFIKAYRDAPINPFRGKFLKRIYSLAKEFFPFISSQILEHHNDKVKIPGDFFINWRSGLRKLVPIRLTVMRFRKAINHAIKTDGVVHLWLHPHNLATGHRQFELLERLLIEAKKYSDQGLLKVNPKTL